MCDPETARVPRATAILKDHDGEAVTPDATQRLVFLDQVRDEWLSAPRDPRPNP
jgi:hypothetical protein